MQDFWNVSIYTEHEGADTISVDNAPPLCLNFFFTFIRLLGFLKACQNVNQWSDAKYYKNTSISFILFFHIRLWLYISVSRF